MVIGVIQKFMTKFIMLRIAIIIAVCFGYVSIASAQAGPDFVEPDGTVVSASGEKETCLCQLKVIDDVDGSCSVETNFVIDYAEISPAEILLRYVECQKFRDAVASTPALGVRSAFFSAEAAECFLRITSAFARSPPASSSAFLHCMTDTPVFSRNSFMISVVSSIVNVKIIT